MSRNVELESAIKYTMRLLGSCMVGTRFWRIALVQARPIPLLQRLWSANDLACLIRPSFVCRTTL